MIRLHQTQFGKPRGNCFATCLACILEIPLDDVPNFCEHDNWRDETDKWLEPYGLFYQDIVLIGDARDELTQYWGYHVISGDGPRGLRHSVVGYRGKMVHDPHPDGGGVSGDIEYGLLIATDPAEIIKSKYIKGLK